MSAELVFYNGHRMFMTDVVVDLANRVAALEKGSKASTELGEGMMKTVDEMREAYHADLIEIAATLYEGKASPEEGRLVLLCHILTEMRVQTALLDEIRQTGK